MILNILIGFACLAVMLSVVLSEHHRQELKKRVDKYNDIIDRALPKIFPYLYEEDKKEKVVVTNSLESMSPTDYELMMLKERLRYFTEKVLEGHQYQISFYEAELKAIEIVERFFDQHKKPLPKMLEELMVVPVVEQTK